MGEMQRQVFLEKAAKGVRGGKRLSGGANGQEAARINRFETDGRDALNSGVNHAGEEEAGEIVGNDDARFRGKRRQKAFRVAGKRLDVGEVFDPGGAAKSADFFGHAVENKAVEAVAGPGIVEAKRLENQERQAKFGRPFQGAVQSEIPGEAAKRNHPVENIAAAGTRRKVAKNADADWRDWGQASWRS